MSDNNKLEKEQATLRIAVVGLIFLYVFFIGNMRGIPTETFNAAVGFGSVNIFASMFLGLFVWKGMLHRVVRRVFGIILDVVSTTVIMYYLADYGAPLFAVYLFVTIGNGFRYGIRYLAICASLSIICFSYLSISSAYWQGIYPIVFSGIVVLTVVPSYVAVLLRRLTLEKARAEQANKEKTRFLANVSHEIRTPLNAVVGFSYLLDRETDGIRRAQLTRNIKDASASLMSLVEGVLDFSRIESG
ncbi:MAG: histidine kinase dimerization/phospho-acceptor domain-containing protein, partial [Gammaproteobacteria bacterium]